jgi:hypothetical protein
MNCQSLFKDPELTKKICIQTDCDCYINWSLFSTVASWVPFYSDLPKLSPNYCELPSLLHDGPQFKVVAVRVKTSPWTLAARRLLPRYATKKENPNLNTSLTKISWIWGSCYSMDRSFKGIVARKFPMLLLISLES